MLKYVTVWSVLLEKIYLEHVWYRGAGEVEAFEYMTLRVVLVTVALDNDSLCRAL